MSAKMTRVTLPTGIGLDVLDTGPRDAPALMFLHGFPESHRTWRHQVAHFSGRFRCIAPDQRGYRGSSKPQEVEAYTYDKLVADVFQLADALEVERFTVLGHDWGGAVAWGVALMGQHSRVDRAIIANAPHPAIFQKLQWTDKAQRLASQYFRTFRDRENDAAIRDHGLIAMLVRGFARTDLANLDQARLEQYLAGLTDPDFRAEQLTEWRDREAAVAMLNWYRASTIEVPAPDEPYCMIAGRNLPTLPRLTIPTLEIWAMDDVALPNSNLNSLPDSIDDLAIVKVPDCGHFVPWMAPEAVNAAIEEFLDRG
jgi:pimeloyl-ACP methyl ester carboxylesterase